MKPDFIPVNQPLLGEREKAYLLECIESGWVSSDGPFVSRFETAFAEKVGRRHGIAVANGSAALDVAVAALELPAGSEVIVPTFTIISCVSSLVRAGLRPVLVDAQPDTWNMDVAALEGLIGPRTSAIMAVHIYGLPVDMTPLLELGHRHGLRVIEDAAQMHGQTYHGRPCGSFGEVSTFSFYANKLITTGEGGMVLTDDDALAERCRSLRNLSFQAHRRFVHETLGWNYRISNLQAAVGLAQVERMDSLVARKRQIGRIYDAALQGARGVQRPKPSMEGAENAYWVYGLVLDDDVEFAADEAARRLGALGVGTRPFFWPMHEQPVFQKSGLFAGEHHPVAERLARRGFYLPSGLGVSDADIEAAARALLTVLS